MRIAITLVHDKTKEENEAQIEFFKALIEPRSRFTESGEEFIYFAFKDLDIPHDLMFMQMIPYHPDLTWNFYQTWRIRDGEIENYETNNYEQALIESGYIPRNWDHLFGTRTTFAPSNRKNDGRAFIKNHPRFFNYGMKRGIEQGADVSIYIENYKKFSVEDLSYYINSLADPNDPHEYAEDSNIRVGSKKMYLEGSEWIQAGNGTQRPRPIRENGTISEGVVKLKKRLIDRGMKNG